MYWLSYVTHWTIHEVVGRKVGISYLELSYSWKKEKRGILVGLSLPIIRNRLDVSCLLSWGDTQVQDGSQSPGGTPPDCVLLVS